MKVNDGDIYLDEIDKVAVAHPSLRVDGGSSDRDGVSSRAERSSPAR
jgi:hypothetical protein